MKLQIYTLFSLLTAMAYTPALFAHTTDANTLKVYVIAGQSNASGIGYVDYQPDQDVELKLDISDISNISDIQYSFWAGSNNQCVNVDGVTRRPTRGNSGDDDVCNADEILRSANPVLSGTATGSRFIPMEFDPMNKDVARFGVEASMARRLKSKRDSSFAIIKVYQGGTNLSRDWNSNLQGETPYSYKLYSELVGEVRARLSDLVSMNPSKTIELAGLIWIQGESDSLISANYTNYEANLVALIENFKSEFVDDSLPVYITELSARPHLDGTALIRDAQWALTQKRRAYSGWEHDVQLIHTSDLEFDSSLVHYTSPSYVKIGQRIADKIIAIDSQDSAQSARPELVQYYNQENSDFRSTRVDAPNENYKYRRVLGRLYTGANSNNSHERWRLVECRGSNSDGTFDFQLRIRNPNNSTRCGSGETFISTPGFIHRHPLPGQRSPLYRCHVPALETNIIGMTKKCGRPGGADGLLLGYIETNR